MVGIYYAAVEDDPLDSGAGSRVFPGASHSTIEGEDGRPRRLALLGDQAWCDACRSAGPIARAPGSPQRNRMIDFTAGGARQALGGDLVLCKCARHPRITPVYGRRWMVNPDVGAAQGGFSSGFDRERASQSTAFDEHFVIHSRETGLPAAGFAWCVRTASGDLEGVTLADGTTAAACGSAPEAVSLIYLVQTEMGIRP